MALQQLAGQVEPAAFGVLGADVTVFDLTPAMLDNDRLAAAHYGFDMQIVQGDMRDLSVFEDNSFDVYTISFGIRNVTRIPDALSEAYRVLQPGGLLVIRVSAHPALHGPHDVAFNTGRRPPR